MPDQFKTVFLHYAVDREGKMRLVYEQGDYLVTVCVVKNSAEVVIARGYSICSPKDQYNRKRGNQIALGRAIKAMSREESSCPVVGKTGKVLGIKFLCQWGSTILVGLT